MRRIKSLGLAALMALALTMSVGAASASAHAEFETVGVANSEIKATGDETQLFDLGGVTALECNNSTAAGTFSSPNNWILTKSLEFGKCGGYPGFPTLKSNGCQISFDPDTEVSAGVFKGEFAVFPSYCGPLTANYDIFDPGRVVSIYPKKGTATLENVPAGKTPAAVRVTLNAEGLKYEHTHGNPDGENGKYTGEWLLKAYTGGGTQVGLRVVKTSESEAADPAGPRPGVHVSGGQFRSVENHYPEPISAEDIGFTPITPGSSSITCTAEFASSLTAPISSRTLATSFSGCTAFGINATANLNSCSYRLNIENASPATGTQKLTCLNEGDAVKITTVVFGFPLCVVSIPAQTLGTATFTNTGNLSGYQVAVKAEGKGLTYKVEKTGFGCPAVGTYNNGSFNESITLHGSSFH